MYRFHKIIKDIKYKNIFNIYNKNKCYLTLKTRVIDAEDSAFASQK